MLHEVVAALILQSNKILLGQRSAQRSSFPAVWDVFGGHMEPGEAQEQTLVRELQEELGITPSVWSYLETFQLLPPEHADTRSDPWKVHLFLVTGWIGEPVNRQPEEHSAIGWFSLTQVTRLSLADRLYPKIFARYLPPH